MARHRDGCACLGGAGAVAGGGCAPFASVLMEPRVS